MCPKTCQDPRFTTVTKWRAPQDTICAFADLHLVHSLFPFSWFSPWLLSCVKHALTRQPAFSPVLFIVPPVLRETHSTWRGAIFTSCRCKRLQDTGLVTTPAQHGLAEASGDVLACLSVVFAHVAPTLSSKRGRPTKFPHAR